MKVRVMNNDTIDGGSLWSRPVRVRIGYGFAEAVRSPEQALEYLRWRWPVREGYHYSEALHACVTFVQNRLPIEDVRDRFVAASIEASMLG
jgi:hypothetical protein